MASCFCECKDTNFLANHNLMEKVVKYMVLFLRVQRY